MKRDKPKIALILGAGKGIRYGSSIPKQFVKLAGKTVIEHTIEAYEKNKLTDEIYIVTLEKYVNIIKNIIEKNKYKKIKKIIVGGEKRQESSYNGLINIKHKDGFIQIHDAVRPLISQEIINNVYKALERYKAVDVSIPSSDTIVKINEKNFIVEIPERKFLWRGQTPQGFHLNLIKIAHIRAKKDQLNNFTDDCGLVSYYNLSKIYVVKGEEKNIKITYLPDIYFAEEYFRLGSIEIRESDNNFDFLKDNVILIYGGNSGIGKEIKNLLIKYKARPYSFSRSNGVDITSIKDIKRSLHYVIKKEKKIDAVIVTAAILIKKNIVNKNYSEIRSLLNTNLLGPILIAKESYKYLKKTKGYLILFTSSSYTRGRSEYVIYSATKSAIVNLVQGLSEEWIKDEIKVNAICPDRTDTPLRKKVFKDDKKNLLDPGDVAKKTLFLLKNKITGQVYKIKNEKIF